MTDLLCLVQSEAEWFKWIINIFLGVIGALLLRTLSRIDGKLENHETRLQALERSDGIQNVRLEKLMKGCK